MKKIELNKQYILDRVDIQSNGCWNWKLQCKIKGYGQLKNKGKHYTSHRLSYELFNGNIPEGLCVCHICDNPPCCNPEHLFIGTHKNNSDDKRNKGRGINPKPQWGNNNSGQKVLAGGIEFKNYVVAGKYYGVSDNAIRKRIKNNWEGYNKI